MSDKISRNNLIHRTMFFLCFSCFAMSSSRAIHSSQKATTEPPFLFTDSQSTLPDPNTLIKVPYYQLKETTGDWTTNFDSQSITSTDSSSTVTYQFNGTQCYLVAHTGSDACTIKIQIDDFVENTTVVDLYSSTNSRNEVVFISQVLIFGEHSIRISYNQPHDEAKTINVAYIFYRPYSIEERLRYNLAAKLSGQSAFQEIEHESYQAITCANGQNECSFDLDFYGTRFWLTGRITNDLQITIDSQQRTVNNEDEHQEFGVLVYFSDVLDLTNHTVSINLKAGSSLLSFLFCQQPYNAINLPLSEIKAQRIKNNPSYFLTTTEFYHETNEDLCKFSFHFYGTRIWAIGQTEPSNDKIELFNSTNKWIADCYANGGDALMNHSFPLGDYSVFLKYHPKDTSATSNRCRVYNIFYINEIPFQTPSSNFILFSDTDYDSNWKTYHTDDNIGGHLYSTAEGATLTIKFVGWKFWLEGFLNPNNGRIQISINGTQIASFRLYREKHEKAAIYYESPDLPLGEHTITLSALDNSSISFSRLFYSFYEDLQSLPLNRLVRVPAFKITRNDAGWTQDHQQIYSKNHNAVAYYTFYGTKVYLYSIRNGKNGDMEVYIDDVFAALVPLYLNSDYDSPAIVFTSKDLPFGQHTITVKHPGTHAYNIDVKTILYCPNLLHANTILSTADMAVQNSWTIQTNTDSSYVQTTTNGAEYQFTFYGTRFWLTGNIYTGPTGGTFNILIDNTITVGPIDTSISTDVTHYSYLLYSSDVLDLKDHNVKITVQSTSKTVALCDLIYSQQPKNATIIYPKDMIKSNYVIVTRYELTTELFYRVPNIGEYYQFGYFGTSFWFFGACNRGSGGYKIWDGSTAVTTGASAYANSETCYFLLSHYTLDYKNHDIKMESAEASKTLVMHYVFYSSEVDEPHEPYFTMYSKDFSYTNDWQKVNDDSESYIESTLIGSKATIKFGGGNFTLEGYLGPCNGMVYIYIDHEYTSNVSLYREEYGYSLFYRSPEDLQLAVHEIDIVNRNGNPVRLSKIYYMPSPTMYFTDSKMFSQSIDFTTSCSFTETTGFTHSEDFTETTCFSNSADFTQSTDFSDSGFFTHSQKFPGSNIFSRTESFSATNSFSKSLSFTSSLGFSKSEYFTESDLFLYTTLSESDFFSESLNFTEQQDLSPGEQTNRKSRKTLVIVVSLVVSLLVIGIIIILLLIFFLRRRKDPTSNMENSFEADSTNLTFSAPAHTLSQDNDDDLNSDTLDVFAEQLNNYEEDDND